LLLELRQAFLLLLVEGGEIHHLRRRVHVGAPGRQRANHVGSSERRRHHQRGLILHLLHGIDVGAAVEQRLHRCYVPGLRREHQGGGAVGRRRIRIGAAGDERFNHPGVSVPAGDEQRAVAADPGCRLHVRAGVEQDLRQLEVAFLDCPMQRRHAVALRRVDVGAILQERLDGVPVTVHRGVDHGRCRRGGMQQRR
jgi:hypothetical protein